MWKLVGTENSNTETEEREKKKARISQCTCHAEMQTGNTNILKNANAVDTVLIYSTALFSNS
jgi:hypothetical protein